MVYPHILNRGRHGVRSHVGNLSLEAGGNIGGAHRFRHGHIGNVGSGTTELEAI